MERGSFLTALSTKRSPDRDFIACVWLTVHRMFKCGLFHLTHTPINLMKMRLKPKVAHMQVKDLWFRLAGSPDSTVLYCFSSVFELPKNIRQLEIILGLGNKDKAYKRLNLIKREWRSYITMSRPLCDSEKLIRAHWEAWKWGFPALQCGFCQVA